MLLFGESVWQESSLAAAMLVPGIASVDNAIRYNRAGGRVEVSLEIEDDPTALLTVQDDGPGIPADQREKVFERFHRGDGLQRSGSGLGLSIVRSAVHRLHGRIFIQDVRREFAPFGRGVAMVVRIPLDPRGR
ncbi:MAG: sensor histidine kinase [Lautropia sp.]